MAKIHFTRKISIVFILFIISILFFWWYKKHHVRFVLYPAFGISIPVNYSLHGIDISKYQSSINWQQVKQMNIDGVHISFVFIKATEGISRQDDLFRQNWKKAKAAGIIRGAYHYFYSTRDPLLQAKNFEKVVDLQPGDLPPVLDIEISNNQPDSVIQATAKTWLREIQHHYGVKPVIYTNIHFYETHLGKAFDDYPLWISHYYKDQQPGNHRSWLFWQHSNSGHVNGISTPVDFNVFNGDLADLQKLCIPVLDGNN